MERHIIIQRMQKLVGNQFNYLGKTYQLIAILDQENRLVLADDHSASDKSVQINQYGSASRRIQTTLEMTLFLPDGELSPDALTLLSGKV